jgi:putative membrane protein
MPILILVTRSRYLHKSGIHDIDINTPLIIARWLTHDVAAVAHRVEIPTLIAAMENNVQAMCKAFRGIDKISKHPAPWPYTHLAQFFLVVWVYTLPVCLVSMYGLATPLVMVFTTLVLFGMDSVAREIQDPFVSGDRKAQSAICATRRL